MSTIDHLRRIVLSTNITGWTKAFCIVVLTERDTMTPEDIAGGVDVPGFSVPVVQQHLDAVDLAIEAGVLPPRYDITEDTPVPADLFDAYYTGIGRDNRYRSINGREAIVNLAEQEGVGATKALDIAKNPRALGIAFRGSDKAQKAILDSLVHVPDKLLRELTVRAYEVMTDRVDPTQRIRDASGRELAERFHATAPKIIPNHAVVVNGTVFVFRTDFDARMFRNAYRAIHQREATLLSDAIVTARDAWASLREVRGGQVGHELSHDEWNGFLDSV